MDKTEKVGREDRLSQAEPEDGLRPPGFDPARLADVKKAEREAWDAVLAAEDERGAEIGAAADKIREAWADRIDAARKAASALRDERRRLEDIAPGHEWESRRVYRVKSMPRRWMSDPPKYERIEGVVETVRSGTPLPANLAVYSRPKVGEPIVRLLKKSGAPGAKFEKLLGFGGQTAWKLCDSDGPRMAETNEDSARGEAGPARAEGIARPLSEGER